MIFFGPAAGAALLPAVRFLVHGRPSAPFGLVLRNASVFVAFLDVLGLALLLVVDGAHAASKLKTRSLPKKRPTAKVSDEEARKAAAAFEREQRRRDAERRKEEAARKRGRAKRDKMLAKAQAAFEKARRAHDERAESLEAERIATEKRIQAEDARWESEKEKLTAALRRARD
jgi:hypothetical protein